MVLRACIEPGCRGYGNDSTRCPSHTVKRAGAKNHRRRSVPSDGSARKLRAFIDSSGVGWRCESCYGIFPPKGLEVDHRLALADGGADVERNVGLLCIACHRAKSAEENKRRRG